MGLSTPTQRLSRALPTHALSSGCPPAAETATRSSPATPVSALSAEGLQVRAGSGATPASSGPHASLGVRLSP